MISIEYHGIVGVVPRRWKTNLFQSISERLHDINNDIANRLKSDTKHHANSFLNCI
jgi:hypothetical protein